MSVPSCGSGGAWLPHPRHDDPEMMQMRAPFTLEWPGLAAPERTPLTPTERQHALDVVLPRIRQANAPGATPQARIGLVAAGRPADVLAVIGWGGLEDRSWGLAASREFLLDLLRTGQRASSSIRGSVPFDIARSAPSTPSGLRPGRRGAPVSAVK